MADVAFVNICHVEDKENLHTCSESPITMKQATGIP